jgi:hypothetical protein
MKHDHRIKKQFLRRSICAPGLVVSFSILASSISLAQSPAAPTNQPSKQDSNPNNLSNPNASQLGGTPATDYIRLTNAITGVPLRYGNVIQGSELVTLNGYKLESGKDYTLDAAVGVIYLQRSVRETDSLSVQYRYDPKAKAPASSSGVAPMKLNLLSGGLTMNFGMGQTERSADGKVIKSNLVGTANNFRDKDLNLAGAYFSGSRQQEAVVGGMQFDSNAKGGDASGETGNSKFLVQAFRANLGGGAVTATYQDVSKGYTGFGAAKEAGFSDKQISDLTRERGLVRQGMGLDKVKLGNFQFSGSQSSVRDQEQGIDTASYSLANSSFSYSRKSESVEKGFRRFQDLGVGDWQRLQQSQGIRRTDDSGELRSKFAKLSFTNTRIEDVERDLAIKQSKFGIDTKNLGFELNLSEVDKGFSRFEADRGGFGLETGLRRQSFNLTKGIVGKDAQLSFGQSAISSESGDFNSRDVQLKGKAWSIESTSRVADTKFNRFGSMQAPEMDSHIRKIADMYGAGTPANANDRGAFMRSSGVGRSNTTAAFKAGKSDVKVSSTQLQGSKSGASAETVSVAGKNLQFNLRKLNVADDFREFNQLMAFEQRALGNLIGLNRTDTSLAMNLGKGKTLDIQLMNAERDQKDASRTKLNYKSAPLDLEYNARSVSKGFNGIGQMEDAERQLLGGMNGFSQSDTRLRATPNKRIRVEYASSQATNDFTHEARKNESALFDWLVDPTLRMGYVKQETENKTPTSVLFATRMERFTMSKTVGKSTLTYASEQRTFGGPNAQPNSDRTSYAVETKVTNDTSLRAERTKTTFSNGDEENLQAHSLSTKISKNVGVSVTDTNIERSDSDRNETRRDYGFWWDFGKGIKMSYGYQRHLNGSEAGTTNTGFVFGQNVNRINPNQALNQTPSANVNGTQIGFANGSNAWDDQIGRTQAFSNFNLATSKPFHLLFLEDCKFNVTSLSASDRGNWLREDLASTFESNLGKYGLGFQYKGQVDQTGSRAIDRTYRFQTDVKGNAPLSATLVYKQRVLPTNQEFAIRDYQVNWKPSKGMVVSHQMQTNPEGPFNPNIILGTLPIAQRRNIWRVDFTGNKNFLFGGQFDEMVDDNVDSIRRTAGFNISLFGKSGSPLNLFYGIEQNRSLQGLNSYVRFGLNFEQRASKNQVFSLSLGNQGWLSNSDQQLVGLNDWIGRLNYQLRFK